MLRAFQKIVGIFHREGVTLLTGTDLARAGGVPGESLHDELDLFVESGLSSLAALRAATIDPARFLGVETELGSLAPGKAAAFLLVSGNPAKDITTLRTPQALVVRGQYLDRAAIDGLLGEARALASRR
jgi:imidazolonepropionase-like amidohydrolase